MVHIPTTKKSHMKYSFALFYFTSKKIARKMIHMGLKVVTQVVERSLILLNKNNSLAARAGCWGLFERALVRACRRFSAFYFISINNSKCNFSF